MKLSEAIRLGSMLRPQVFGRMFLREFGREPLASCAMGAAGEAVGFNHESLNWEASDVLARTEPVEYDGRCPCGGVPLCRGIADGLLAVIIHLNDDHHWTREAIADWLDTLEQPKVQALSANWKA